MEQWPTGYRTGSRILYKGLKRTGCGLLAYGTQAVRVLDTGVPDTIQGPSRYWTRGFRIRYRGLHGTEHGGSGHDTGAFTVLNTGVPDTIQGPSWYWTRGFRI